MQLWPVAHFFHSVITFGWVCCCFAVAPTKCDDKIKKSGQLVRVKTGKSLYKSQPAENFHGQDCQTWWKYARLREICLNASVYNAMKYLQVQFKLSSVQCSGAPNHGKLKWFHDQRICAFLKTARPSRIRQIDKEIKPVNLSLEKVR